MKRYFCCILFIFIAVHFSVAAPLTRERIYVQTDKSLYLAGEPVLLKLLTTDTEQIPLVFSKIAYVELVDNSSALIQIKVEMSNGTGSGIMQLPVEISTGYYRLIAYTQFMRNEGADVFFEKNIAVLNTFQSDYYPPEDNPETANGVLTDENIEYGAVSLRLDKTNYAMRQRGELLISGLPENIHTLSVSIAGKELFPIAESNVALFRNNLSKKSVKFTGEYIPEYEGHIITGKIIENQVEDEKPEELELESKNEDLLIEIKEQINVLDSLINTLQDRLDDNILTIISNLRQSLSNLNDSDSTETIDSIETIENVQGNESNPKLISPALAFPGRGINFFAGQIGDAGDVRFYTSDILGTKEIATVVYFPNEKYRVDIQSPFVASHAHKQMPVLRVDTAYYRQLLARSVALQLFHYFSDDEPEDKIESESYFKLEPTWSYPLDEYTRFTTMREVFLEFIVGARFRRNAGKQELSVMFKRGDAYNYGTMPLVILDGVPVADHDAIFNYDPLSVEMINIYYGPLLMGGYLFDGIIELITYRRLYQNLRLNRATQVLRYEGPQKPLIQQNPDYSEEKNRNSRIPDARHTLLWNPDVKTNGKTSITLPFDTSDLAGEYQATVEGITKEGKIFFSKTFFEVE